MEIVMGVMIIIMIVGFSVFGYHDRMMGGHSKDKQKEEQVIKDNDHKKSDCKVTGEGQEDSAIDKDNTNCEEIKN